MNTDELQKLKNQYKQKIIRINHVENLVENSRNAYSETKALNKGYTLLSSHNISEYSLRDSLYSHNTEIIFQKIKDKFEQVYAFDSSNIHFIGNRTQGNVNAFCGENLIFFDRMLEDTLHAFFMVTLIWAKYFNNEDVYGRFFNYLTTVIYAAMIDKSTYNIYKFEYIQKEIDQWSSTVNRAVSCQYFSMYFCIAHEVAHKYIEGTGLKIGQMQEEFRADAIAYDIVLRLLMDEANSNIDDNDRELFEYCYLSPMMIFDFWDVLFYANRLITNTYITDDNIHPRIKKRKESLFSIPYRDEYEFDSVEGNAVYSSFLDVIDKYKTELLYRKENGTLYDFLNYMRGL